ncbi:hypothetical protein C1H46_014352 [Malus baccata]|uniref:Set2 Rpb1 interacting domain-containing protein n=1 Tax=Malus baccata TaxID=106549 RepID=A0A540MMF4_MALBA|nr:hypothetical protein C1H46_014352 [Malus baccata]
MAMVQRGEKPPNVKDIDDSPPNLNQQLSNPRLAPRAKPWEVGQAQNNSSQVFQSQVSSEGLNSSIQDNGQGVGSGGSRQTTSSPSSARAAGQLLPKSDGEQYDPLWDSIEPSSALLKKHGHGQKQESAGDSNIIVRLSENKHKEVETVASATSLDIDEFGETADAEVGVVEDESLSDPGGAANMAGEIEIDQVESPGKSKKKKDSRSTRLFKIAIANFVKEILKPSWRQGNMSKEAFKTIVKKTVDKVSGAMKKHQIPKSEAKINHYIDSSQRKLTKLVMTSAVLKRPTSTQRHKFLRVSSRTKREMDLSMKIKVEP